MTLMARRAKQDFIFKLMTQSWFPVNNKVQYMFAPILIPDKNTRELRIDVNPTSKMFKFSRYFGLFMFRQKTLEKSEKNNPS